MKKILLLSILIFSLFHVYSQTQITLTFTAKDSITQNPVSLDSVYIKNLVENCDTLLYGPTPVLSFLANWPVGIGAPVTNSREAFILKQNYPNPFQGSTFVSIYKEYRGSLNLTLFDGLGTKRTEYHNEFEKGFHSFVISSSGNKVLFLVVSDDKNYRSIKIICTGKSNESSTIRYLGQTHPIEKSIQINPENGGFIFYLGNQMMYTAYANGYHNNTKFDNPITSTEYIFNLVPLNIVVIPTVTTAEVINITQTTATSGGTVSSDGGATVTARGICWSTSPNPTTADSHTTDGSGTGAFVSNLTGLTSNTYYYVRAYATNSVGTAYGNDMTFTTLPNPVLPTVTTTAVTDISQTTATSGGNITSDGYATVTARGVCWSTSPNPTTADSHTTDGSGTGIFVSYITGLTPNTPYYIRAYATNSVGTAYGNELTFNTLAITLPTITTATVTNIAQTTATSGGTVTSDGGVTVTARGVCWNTSSNPTTANSHTSDGSGTGTFVSNLTGLNVSTVYYVRAYATNSVGTAYGNELTFTTLAPVFTCGDSVTINHLAGVVAPVTKTVTYGTITNIPGETSKCWITSNLGADHQATTKDDATEASAGWYWQFNRKQGYKHDGTTRTPNTTWISTISESSNWTAASDPCTLELGSGWRIPTNSEWTNVDASGNWNNWNGPWNSALKMHAAGNLGLVNGSLYNRGLSGGYWSSMQSGVEDGWELGFDSSVSAMNNPGKANGLSLRCIKD